MLGSWNLESGEENDADYAPPEIDKWLLQGIDTTKAATRFTAYSKILQNLAVNVPIVPLFTQDDTVAISDKFTFPGLNQYVLNDGAYPLEIKPAA